MNSRGVREKLERIFPISDPAYERLEILVSRLLEWQKKTNLIAASTLEDIWMRHVADSLQCVAINPDARYWLDLGSGGGFPGLVIAAVMADFSESEVTLVESNQKKTAFLRQANRHMDARANIVTSRIETFESSIKPPQIVTARALASLSNLLHLSQGWLSAGAVGMFHKGRDYQLEIEECNGVWRFDLVHHESRISPDSVVLEIRNLERITGPDGACPE